MDPNWDQIRAATAPEISSDLWKERRWKIGIVGLMSELSFRSAYQQPNWSQNPKRDQTHEAQQVDNDHPRQNDRNPHSARFNGNEPFLLPPRVGAMGILECYGIYVKAASNILPKNLLDKVDDQRLHDLPAILLCPERIDEIHRTIARLGEVLSPPPSLPPSDLFLRMTLLHELGHHFFPVQENAGAGHFLSEGLANFVCYHALDHDDRAWLLYKTWYLQPPEYSAYRPLNALHNASAKCRSAIAKCFTPEISSWVSLPKKAPDLTDSLKMALAADTLACNGLGWGVLADSSANSLLKLYGEG